MTWPTISKGIFYKGYESGKQESPKPGERDVNIPNPPNQGNSGVTHTRVVQGGNQHNENNLRKPFG